MRIGDVVWVCEWEPSKGPWPAIVCAINGASIDVQVFGESGCLLRRDVTPWAVEDGSKYGWLEIPIDGVVPVDLFEVAQ